MSYNKDEIRARLEMYLKNHKDNSRYSMFETVGTYHFKVSKLEVLK